MNLVPSIGLSGAYSLLDPFASQLIPGMSYTCTATRAFSDLIADGVDPKATYYTANGVADSKYTEDLDSGVCIVTLTSTSGSNVRVPSSFISSYPNMSGVSYTGISMLVKLGAVADTMSLDYLKTRIINVTSDTVGITPTVQTVAVSPSKIVSSDDHKLIEAARQSKIVNSTTDSATALRLQSQVDSMRQQIAALEEYIRVNGL